MGYHILIVEDDFLIAKAIGRILSGEGYTFTHAINGRQALEQLPQCRPDLILLDLWMPHMNGVDFLQVYSPHCAVQAPVIMMSSSIATLDSGLARQVQGFMPKPFTIQLLIDTVKGHLPPTLH